MLETGAALPFLCCRIGIGVAAIPLACVRETLRPLPLEALAGMPAFVLGLAVVRGTPVPVIDADRLFGAGDGTTGPTRWVLLCVGERTVALAVAAVLEVRALTTTALAEVPPLMRGSDTDCISVMGTLDAELLLVLECARLMLEALPSAVAGANR